MVSSDMREKRQACDELSALGGQDSPRLRFETQNDASCFAQHLAEDGMRWASERGFTPLKDYLKRRAGIRLIIGVAGHPQKIQLIMEASGAAKADHLRPWQCQQFHSRFYAHQNPRFCHRYLQNTLMFSRSGHSKEAIESSIPSIVGFEVADECDDIGMHMFAPTPDLTFQIPLAAPNGEVNSLPVLAAEKDCCIANPLIKGMFDIAGYPRSKDTGYRGYFPVQAEAVNMLSGLIVRATDDSVSAYFKESFDALLKVEDAYFYAIE